MKPFLYIVSFFWVAAGACVILYTEEARQFSRQVTEGVNIRVLSVAGILFCVLLLAAAPAARNSWFINLIGLIGIIKGVVFLLNPLGIWETTKSWYVDRASDQTFRFFGILMLMIGTAVFSWV